MQKFAHGIIYVKTLKKSHSLKLAIKLPASNLRNCTNIEIY